MKSEKKKFVCLILVYMFCLGITKYSQTSIFPDNICSPSLSTKQLTSITDACGNFVEKQKNNIFSIKKEGIYASDANINSVGTATSGELYVYPGGDLIGIKLDTKGVICVEYEDLPSDGLYVTSPAKEADILPGDIITHIDGLEVNSADEFERILSFIGSDEFDITLKRDEVILNKSARAVLCEDNVRRIGMWVRDNVVGLGTLSFVTKDEMNFAALGHPISDSETGITVPVKSGELVGAEVMRIVKGRINHPGEIRGIIRKTAKTEGSIVKNNDFGIYGTIGDTSFLKDRALMPVGKQDEIKEGKAYIITTVDDVKKSYEISIEKVYDQQFPDNRSMLIKITDDELLEKTGGIIQGMSGSPVIQNGKLIGAVTHVLTADPTRGYAVFAEWMIKNCSSCQTSTAFCMGILYNESTKPISEKRIIKEEEYFI